MAIVALHGAATNEILAFFGGGSLVAGDLGMTGETIMLGGLVAGPALMVMGFIVDVAAKKLEQKLTNQEEATRIAAELNTGSQQFEAIRMRIYMFYNLLARLDARFLPLIYRIKDIIRNERNDHRCCSDESKKVIVPASALR